MGDRRHLPALAFAGIALVATAWSAPIPPITTPQGAAVIPVAGAPAPVGDLAPAPRSPEPTGEIDLLLSSIAELIRFLDFHGLNDPASPVRLETPLLPDDPWAARKAAALLAGDGVRTIVDMPVGRGLALWVDGRIPEFFGKHEASPLGLEYGFMRPAVEGGREILTIRVRNDGAAPLRDVAVWAIASIVDRPPGDPDVYGISSDRLHHTLRLLPEAAPKRAGALESGETRELVAEIADAPDSRGGLGHLYFVATFRDADGTLRMRFAHPRDTDAGVAADVDGEDHCLPRSPGFNVNTRIPGCSWDDCLAVLGDDILLVQDEQAAREDFNGDGEIDWGVSRVVSYSIGRDTLTEISPGWGWRIDGDLVAILSTEGMEGIDVNGDGDTSDALFRWYRRSEGVLSESIVGSDLRLRSPWIAFQVWENGSDLDGNGRTGGSVIRLLDTRDGTEYDFGVQGSSPILTDSAVVFETIEQFEGPSATDLNGDGDSYDDVLRWIALPGAAGLPDGVQNTGLTTVYGAKPMAGDRILFTSSETDSREDLDGDGSIEIYPYVLRTLIVGSSATPRVLGRSVGYVADPTRVIWHGYRQEPFRLLDFSSGEEQRLPVGGWLGNLEGNLLHFLEGPESSWELQAALHDLATGETRRLGMTHAAGSRLRGDVVSWHNDVDSGDACYAWWAPWIEYHRISTGGTYATGASAYKYSTGAAGPRLLAFIQFEQYAGRDLVPGRDGFATTTLTYHVFPCESFDDLDTHVDLAVVDDPAVHESMKRKVRRAREQYEAGNVPETVGELCSLRSDVRTPGAEHVATRSAQLVEGCLSSLGVELGILPSEDQCGETDNCPAYANPMQEDLDLDGIGTSCDNCPEDANPDQADADGDGPGDACDPCPHAYDSPAQWIYDGDADGVGDNCDNCPEAYNPEQVDSDQDGVGDPCDDCVGPGGESHDWDRDGFPACKDNCPVRWNPLQEDADGDGFGDLCDNCPSVSNPDQADRDGDRLGDACDDDSDNDGIPDAEDACPFDSGNDSDGDGFCADVDNCPRAPNPDQADRDGDGVGDLCDNCPDDRNSAQIDQDGDGVGNTCDNCWRTPNPDQADEDADGAGDACDNCLGTPNPGQDDSDSDGNGNACDSCPFDGFDDADGDGLCADADNCPNVSNPDQANRDGDAFGDACDRCPDLATSNNANSDGDAFGDACDNCPGVSNDDQADRDGDSFGDSCDRCPDLASMDNSDGDGDGVGNACDPCPYDRFNDADGDGICGDLDNCDFTPNPDQSDRDGDLVGDVCDTCPGVADPSQVDRDLDGIGDACDNCPNTYNENQVNRDGDPFGDACDRCPDTPSSDNFDSDGDWIGDACDPCPYDAQNDADGDGACGSVDNCPNASNPGQEDRDGDGVGDLCDNCPEVANGAQADGDNDGDGDVCDPCPGDAGNDADGDGWCADADNCPGTPNPDQADRDGDGLGDACDACPDGAGHDDDVDGVCSTTDNCPDRANPDQADRDGDGIGDVCDACPDDSSNDVDFDGICGNVDNCPDVRNANQRDQDVDGVGDVCDLCPLDFDPGQEESDGDGVGDACDNCPDVYNPDQADSDTAPEPFSQWAASATASSQYGDDAYAAFQATGLPDVGYCADWGAAWAPLEGGTVPEWLEVRFSTPVASTGADVVESWIGSFVTRIETIDEAGVYRTVWEALDGTPCGGTLEARWAETPYVTVGLRIHTSVEEWEEIDAVALHGIRQVPAPDGIGDACE